MLMWFPYTNWQESQFVQTIIHWIKRDLTKKLQEVFAKYLSSFFRHFFPHQPQTHAFLIRFFFFLSRSCLNHKKLFCCITKKKEKKGWGTGEKGKKCNYGIVIRMYTYLYIMKKKKNWLKKLQGKNWLRSIGI